MCHNRHVPVAFSQEDSKWHQAFLGSRIVSALKVRLGLDGGDWWWRALR
jgi:hypothetical protein